MFKKFTDGISDDEAYNKNIAEISVRKLNSAAAKAKVVLLVGMVLSLILATLICYSVVRAINWLVAQVQRSALQVASSVTEIAATAKEHQAASAETAQLTKSAQQTIDSLHQSSIVMDQLNSTANDLRASVSRLGVQTT